MAYTPSAAKKKPGDDVTMGKVLVAAAFNFVLGTILAFCVLAGTVPQLYDPKVKKPGDKLPAPPAGIWYREGKKTGGDWRSKEAAFLAAQPGQLSLTDADLNSWAAIAFKPAAGKGKPATPAPATPAKPGAPAAPSAPAGDSYAIAPGIPNFRAEHLPEATTGYFQIAFPFNLTVMGYDVTVLYQARGRFVNGPNGLEFEPFFSALGCARLPIQGGIAKSFAAGIFKGASNFDALKKYAAVWPKLSGAEPGDGELTLSFK